MSSSSKEMTGCPIMTTTSSMRHHSKRTWKNVMTCIVALYRMKWRLASIVSMELDIFPVDIPGCDYIEDWLYWRAFVYPRTVLCCIQNSVSSIRDRSVTVETGNLIKFKLNYWFRFYYYSFLWMHDIIVLKREEIFAGSNRFCSHHVNSKLRLKVCNC